MVFSGTSAQLPAVFLWIVEIVETPEAIWNPSPTFCAKGLVVSIFPEGTSTDGSSIKDLKARSFEAAIISGMPVEPRVFSYQRPK